MKIKLPCDECGGRCCTYPAMTAKEFKRINIVAGFPSGAKKIEIGLNSVMIHMEDGTCPYLKQGKCSVYEVRPKVCQLYGMIPEMPCEYLYPELAQKKAHDMAEKIKLKLKG